MKRIKTVKVKFSNKTQSIPCGGYFAAKQGGNSVLVYCTQYDGQVPPPCDWVFTKVGDPLPDGMGVAREVFKFGGRDYTLSSNCIA